MVKNETANMTEEELAEILRFDDDESEEFAVSGHKGKDAEMEDVSEIAATQSDHSSGKVKPQFLLSSTTTQAFYRHSIHCSRTRQGKGIW